MEASSTKAVKLSINLSWRVATRREFFARLKKALDAIAQGIESLVDGMLYFPGCSAGDCGFTTAFLNVVADGTISCIKPGNKVTSCACADNGSGVWVSGLSAAELRAARFDTLPSFFGCPYCFRPRSRRADSIPSRTISWILTRSLNAASRRRS